MLSEKELAANKLSATLLSKPGLNEFNNACLGAKKEVYKANWSPDEIAKLAHAIVGKNTEDVWTNIANIFGAKRTPGDIFMLTVCLVRDKIIPSNNVNMIIFRATANFAKLPEPKTSQELKEQELKEQELKKEIAAAFDFGANIMFFKPEQKIVSAQPEQKAVSEQVKQETVPNARKE